MKKRDITKDEINKITQQCPKPREKAFFTIMRQSGLPPHTIKQLKIKDLERILEPDTPIPCKITIPYEKSPTFIGQEAVKYLKQYLATRTNKTPESLLFTTYKNPTKQIDTKDISRAFKQAAQKKIAYEVKKGKPSEIRLYSLIEFYRKNAKLYITELHNNTTPKNDEFYRTLYETNDIPNLEIEPTTRIEIPLLQKENRQLKERLTKIEKTIQETVMPVRRLYYELSGIIPEDKDILIEELKPDIPEKNEQDNQERIQKTLHKLLESHKEEDKKALASTTTNKNDVPSKNAPTQ